MTITIDEYKTLIDIISRNTETERPPRRSPTGWKLYEVYAGDMSNCFGYDKQGLERVQHHILTELRKDIAREQEKLPMPGWGLWNVVDKIFQQWLKENE